MRRCMHPIRLGLRRTWAGSRAGDKVPLDMGRSAYRFDRGNPAWVAVAIAATVFARSVGRYRLILCVNLS